MGISFGILAALCQAVGLIMMKPILDLGADPIASAAIRTTVSCIMLSFTFFLKSENFISPLPINLSILLRSIISGFLGMALGMSLLLIALQNADAGIVATLSSTSPIIILFLIWMLTKKIPQRGGVDRNNICNDWDGFNFYLLILNQVLPIYPYLLEQAHSSLSPLLADSLERL